ncbi:hypothetical protein DFS34DRAFT_607278 [Phlyctochytrium arcticum]|nr:hypothetical protein DFS34DRAFT_607278 [Phlyctochytrium arcticum]
MHDHKQIVRFLIGATIARMIHARQAGNCAGESIYSLLPPKAEPSDAIFDQDSQRLFVVGDEGTLTAISDVDAGPSAKAQIFKLGKTFDLEGVTLVPERKDTVYLGNEFPASIIEYDLATSSPIRTFNFQTTFDNFSTGTVGKNDGLESVAFVPSPRSAWGGFFFVGRQADARTFIFELPVAGEAIASTATDIKYRGFFQPPGAPTDLSQMTVFNNHLFFLYDGALTMTSMTLDSVLGLIEDNKEIQVDATTLGATDIGTFQFKTLGQEALAFANTASGAQWVFVGLDPKGKSGKDLLRFDMPTFLQCFQGGAGGAA